MHSLALAHTDTDSKENKWHAISPMLVSHHIKCIQRTLFSLPKNASAQHAQPHTISIRLPRNSFKKRFRICVCIAHACRVCSASRNREATAHSSLLIKIIWVNLLAAICTLFTATPDTSNLFSFFSSSLLSIQLCSAVFVIFVSSPTHTRNSFEDYYFFRCYLCALWSAAFTLWNNT